VKQQKAYLSSYVALVLADLLEHCSFVLQDEAQGYH